METIVRLVQLATAVLQLLRARTEGREDHPARGRHFAAKDAKGRMRR